MTLNQKGEKRKIKKRNEKKGKIKKKKIKGETGEKKRWWNAMRKVPPFL